jgi:hypothetical protein
MRHRQRIEAQEVVFAFLQVIVCLVVGGVMAGAVYAFTVLMFCM